jgi:organic radical activating enzyme
MTPLETAKARTLKEISGVLRACYSWAVRGCDLSNSSWYRDRLIQTYSGGDPEKVKECEELIQWGHRNLVELEVYMAGRSPSTVANWSVRHNRRLCPEAEKVVKEKAKDRSTLLDYCSHFDIVLDDFTKVTMKAAFQENSQRETAYIKKIELTKKRTKEFLEQMAKIGEIDPNITVKELLETL